MYSTKLNGTTVLANESGNPVAYFAEKQANAAAEKINGKAFQIRPNGDAFYVQINEDDAIRDELWSSMT